VSTVAPTQTVGGYSGVCATSIPSFRLQGQIGFEPLLKATLEPGIPRLIAWRQFLNPLEAGVSRKPTRGLEPRTPSLRVKCSTS
jgi:hypothetical protein